MAAATRTAPNSARRRELAWVVALVVLAVVVRVIYVLQMRASPLFDAPVMDAKYHVDWATAFARGESFQPGPFFRAPLYPWFLGVCFELFGPSLLVPRLLQTLFGGATVLLVYLIGARVFGARVGKLAAFGASVSWLLVFYDGELLLEALATPLNLLGLWLFLRAKDSRRAFDSVACGVAFGLAAITRPTILLVAVALAIAWLVVERARKHDTLRALAWAALGLAAPILPITLYNGRVGHDWVLISSQSGVNLWIGNNPASDGATAIVPGTRADWWGGYYDSIALAETAEGRKLKPSEVSSYYTRRALGFWRDQPVQALAHTAHKLRLLWLDWEIGNNEEPRFLARTYAPISAALLYSFAVVAALAVIGLASARGRGAWPLGLFVVFYGASVVVFFVCSRYRVPLVPVLFVLGARGAEWLFESLRARRFVATATALAAVGVSLAMSYWNPPGLATGDANGQLLIGGAEFAAGRAPEAIARYRRALESDPRNWIARRQLAAALRKTGDQDGAEREYRTVLAEHPDDTTALDELADLALARSQITVAVDLAERLVAAAPFDARGDYTLGRARYAERNLPEARLLFASALQKDPSSFAAAYALAMLELELGDRPASIKALELAVASPRAGESPTFELAAWKRLILQQREAGDLDAARRTLGRARARFPDDPDWTVLEAGLR
ncbi:MAG: glycosyltransferase family 39 protein [Planctomycetes bacterium]|nr:glycosyltransferase family 39 protein [Planctomycetota bacterium]